MNWEWKNLSDVCYIAMGKTPSRSNKKYWDEQKNSSNVWLSIADLTNAKTKYISDSKEYVTDLGASLFKPVAKGTLLMSFKLSIGKLAFAGTELRTNEAIVALPIKNEGQLSKNYLYYYLSYYDWDKEAGNDVKVKGKTLNKEKLKNIKIPLPSLATQQKIVDKLDAIFAEIDRATVATEANVKNAEALFQSYLNEVFNNKKEVTKRLKDCCLIKPSKSEAKALNEDDYVSFMPMETLGVNEKYAIPNQVRKLSDVVGSYTYFSEGDVLLAKITPCFENGKLGIAKNLVNRSGFGSSEYIVFRPNAEVDSAWLYYFLNREQFRINGAKHMSGAVGHKRVTKDFIEDSMLPLPSLAIQRKFVEDIERIFDLSKSIIVSSNLKLREYGSLKQSILKQAFSGELVKE